MNVSPKAMPYGSWPSPITAHTVAADAIQFNDIQIAEETLFWLEGRPVEGGRNALMSWNERQGEKELLPKEYNVRTRVHEYGGGALLIGASGIYFINDHDQQIHCLQPNGTIRKITSVEKGRFADGCEHPSKPSLFYVMEEHGDQVINSIVQVDRDSGEIKLLASGHDFYSSPRLSPDGRLLAYITWDHPNMPWDGTELWTLDLQSGEHRLIAGGPSESIANPQWSTDGELYFLSDRTNWWNLYRAGENKPLWAVEGELSYPQWTFGMSWYGFSKRGIFCSYAQKGSNLFAHIMKKGSAETVELPFTFVKYLSVGKDKVAMLASSPRLPTSVILYDLTSGKATIVKGSRTNLPDEAYLSQPLALEFPTTDGRTAHAFYYPPCNPKYCGMPGEMPPLLVESHGGPTAHKAPGFYADFLYWTSRGFAVVQVNYGGSSGYGREYRDRLKGQWGIVDVDDCTNAALYCAEHGLADRNRLAIEGGSSGGYTTLAALAFRDVFKVGADYFGVSDLERLTLDTHKFESRYLDQLVGLYPQEKAVYLERSPIYSSDRISCPVIIFQGSEDAIVPPSQSQLMYESLRTRNIPTAYFLYQGEQHGFRKAETIQSCLEAQLYFFSKILGFSLSDDIEPIAIDNFPSTQASSASAEPKLIDAK